MPALTIAATWINAALNGLTREGLDRTALTAGLPGIEHGRVADTARVEISLVRRIWQRAATLSSDPLLGLKVGGRMAPQAANVITIILMHSPSLGEALPHALRYQRLLSESGRFIARPSPEGLRLVYEVTPAAVPIDPLQIDSVTAAMVAGGPPPRLVHLVGRAGDDAEAFAALLGCPVVLGATVGGIDYDAAALALPIVGADPALRDLCLAHAETMLVARQGMEALCQDVRAAIGKLGPASATLDLVAAELGCAPRSLQRRLNLAGAGFKSLLEAYRMDEALVLLCDSSASLVHMAELLGYSEVSALSRAVSRWWGATPGQLRASRRI